MLFNENYFSHHLVFSRGQTDNQSAMIKQIDT